MNQVAEAVFLAWRDWKFERLLSLCAVLALASMLAPLLVLQGLKNGVTAGMRERLMKEPETLIITPKSDAGRYTPEFIAQLAKLPGASYAIGRTRDTGTDLTLENVAAGKRASIALEPASPGEPVLGHNGMKAPVDGKEPEIVLSATAAKSLDAAVGQKLEAKLGRRAPDGKFESLPLTFHVAGILPIAAAGRRMAFVPLKLLEDMEDYRDYIAVPERGFEGAAAAGPRSYASFRLYARELDDVERLAGHLESLHIEVITRAREIAQIKSLEAAINEVILIISIAVGAGFAAFMISSSEGAIRRKKRMLGMLRLLGFRRLPLMCYPLAQTLLTSLCGFILSMAAYFLVAEAIARAFADRGSLACRLGPGDVSFAVIAVLAIAVICSIKAAMQAASLEPSMVIREV